MDAGFARTLLTVFLHDPPDKALDIKRHESRARHYLAAALSEDVDRTEAKDTAQLPDQIAAIIERVPMPTAGSDYSRAVGAGPEGSFTIRHPLSANRHDIRAGAVDTERTLAVLRDLVDENDGMEKRLLTIWRLLPEKLAQKFSNDWLHLPADTRLPDHTFWHHVDIATGIAAAASPGGIGFLSFSIGPVQSFIAAARSLRDLWSGSALLSWLAFQGMTPILEEYGPTAFVFPSLRGNALLDHWLRGRGVDVPSVKHGPVAGLPNRFLALVPYGRDGETGQEIGKRCEHAARKAWLEGAEKVREGLIQELGDAFPGWDARWAEQIRTLPEVSWTVVPERELTDEVCAKLAGGDFATIWPDSAAIRALATAIPAADRPGYRQDQAGRWQAQIETVARIAEATRLRRPVPALSVDGDRHPPKCSILGTFDQMGPVDFVDAANFWERMTGIAVNGVRVRAGERLSAASLVKRFAAPLILNNVLPIDSFPDTATVAARCWLERAKIDPKAFPNWSGQWLHGEKTSEDEELQMQIRGQVKDARDRHQLPPPPAYYAVLLADGDEMGNWLAGRNAPSLREVMHPTLIDYYNRLGDAQAGLDARRPVGPGLHAAISAALHHFATIKVPRIICDARGVLVYAGGDDVLALVPADSALRCAMALREAFSADECMGKKASLSLGMAVVHYKEDLRAALNAAREAEKKAKADGRNRLGLQVMRRSGEHVGRTMKWEIVCHLEALRETFVAHESDRWAYRLRAEATILDGLVPDAIEAEFRRLLARAEISPATREKALVLFEACASGRAEKHLAEFVAILAQSASFLARGNDR